MFVVGVGNITFGGTGKTPFVIELANRMKDRVCVVSRGYRGKREGRLSIVSDGKEIFYSPEDVGDEPCLIAEKTGAVVITSVRREEAIQVGKDEFGIEIFILDDAFQYRHLKKDLNILLFNSDFPFFPPRDLPGYHRFADMGIVVDRGKESILINRIKIPLWRGRIISQKRGAGERVVAFCGIGRPDSFKKLLVASGYNPVRFIVFRDHHIYSERDVERIKSIALKLGVDRIVTTEKDWIKVRGRMEVEPVPISLTLDRGFWNSLSTRLPFDIVI